jgi:hypothetical protein
MKNQLFTFDWSNFSPAQFSEYKRRASTMYDRPTYDYFGAVYCGELCFDILAYDVDDTLYMGFDLYVGGDDTGYGYSCREALASGKYTSEQEVPIDERYPYDEADGGAFPGEGRENLCLDLTYSEFQTMAEKVFSEYILGGPKRTPSLEEKARMPLHIW